MLNIFPDPKGLSCKAKLLRDSLKRSYDASRMVGPVEVPCIEARKVLEGAEKFIAADY